MRIGPLALSTPLLLAPMAAVTDLPFRTICEQFGVGLTITEFLSADALVAGDPKITGKLTPSLDGVRFGVQIYGREVAPMIEAAHMAVDIGASLIDINMGCPAKRVVAGACGAALMQWPSLAAELVEAVVGAVPAEIPVSVKHRAGWNPHNRNAPEFARVMVEAGAQMITVHGRTRTQGFSGTCDLDIIAKVRTVLPSDIPVIGNGDITDVDSYLRMRSETGCDGVMIGRGALGNPWLFSRLREVSAGRPDPGPPTIAQRLAVFRQHVTLIRELKAGPKLIHELRKACAWYSKGLRGCNDLRLKVWKIFEPDAAIAATEAFLEATAVTSDTSMPSLAWRQDAARGAHGQGLAQSE